MAIRVTSYDARVDEEREPLYANGPNHVAVRWRDPTWVFDVSIVATGADGDKFLAMLKTLTGQDFARPGSAEWPEGEEPLALPSVTP
jgi:hypothetical protein